MTPEAQRIAIAEVCGAQDCSGGMMTAYWPKSALPMLRALKCSPSNSDERPGMIFALVPDYLSDLNAMHAAEKASINASNEAYYRGFLVIACGEWKFHRASAAIRAEALLRTLGRWEE